MFGDFNGQIKLRAKQKFKFLSATSSFDFRVFSSFLMKSSSRTFLTVGSGKNGKTTLGS